MNPQEIEDMWDQCRDGELTGSRRDAFDEHMLDDAELAALWGAESHWLEAIGDTDGQPGRSEEADARFSRQLLARWEEDRRHRARVRLFWRRALVVAGCATAAAVAVLVSWAPQRDASTGPQMAGRDPVTILVSDMNEQAWTQPEQLYNAVRGTQDWFTVEQAIRLGVGSPREKRERR